MTITMKELRELTKDVPEDYEVCIEYDGPETLVDLPAKTVYISFERKSITLISDERE